ncbi:TRAP transporter small permease subunit [SAR92 clade bacterium H921]|jgi:TRAP-type mannitol/chloroaromatic compound transport system permease small subunit|nr:TRAP transporter small permease subunit [SAR92 clade bacterium H921]MDG0972322.1 TRAP transporter small permease subunit [Porticoccaceae bacterium]MDG1306713.1 TRAP transporter small permease subunit [Porticoccaceae bacterium]
MVIISGLIDGIDRFTDVTGRMISWLTLLMVALVVTVVIMRYYLEFGSIALQESVTYIHAMVFMLGLAFTLKRGGHVRVDIFYRQFSVRRKALVDLLGGVFFLIPVCVLIFISSWDYVLSSWSIAESSAENDGLPYIYLLKTLMLIMPITLLLQGVSEILRSALVVVGWQGDVETRISQEPTL